MVSSAIGFPSAVHDRVASSLGFTMTFSLICTIDAGSTTDVRLSTSNCVL